VKQQLIQITFTLLLLLPMPWACAQLEEWDVGLSSQRFLIRAQGVSAADADAPTVLLIGGLSGPDGARSEIAATVEQYSQLDDDDRTINLLTIPLANPDSENLQFPPAGNAYAENSVSHALWRWIGVHGPDLVAIVGGDAFGFQQAIETIPVADIGTVSAVRLPAEQLEIDQLSRYASLARSPARQELERRLARTPLQLARQLTQVYGHDFSTPAYVPGMGLVGRLRLGQLTEVEGLLAPYLEGQPVEVNGPSVMAGQLVFAEHAEVTGNPRSLQLVINAASLAFDDQGELREAMPYHAEMSDSVFMAPPLLVKAGKLSGDSRYFDMAARHVEFMQRMLLREDGLYRHSPLADVAWSRGNAFPALGLALVLSDFPEQHPAFGTLMQSFLAHLDTLLPFQGTDGLWHQVVDYPGSFTELSSSSMIGIAIKRGIDRGWLVPERFQPVLDRIWHAVLLRTSFSSEFIDVCASTGKLESLDAYLDRLAISGRDDRAGGMIMNLAVELAY
jgi:unsaturated rhamnogalacturonyl hydrolase